LLWNSQMMTITTWIRAHKASAVGGAVTMVVHSAQLPRGSRVAYSFLLEGQLASVLVHLWWISVSGCSWKPIQPNPVVRACRRQQPRGCGARLLVTWRIQVGWGIWRFREHTCLLQWARTNSGFPNHLNSLHIALISAFFFSFIPAISFDLPTTLYEHLTLLDNFSSITWTH